MSLLKTERFINMINKEPRFKIGDTWTQRGKFGRECEIIDIYKTYNSKGELVEIRYKSGHEFMGQVVTHYDVETTIAMAKAKKGEL